MSDLKPMISVIVPVYNDEEYLSNCLDSLLYQSFDNYEVILIDDGSTDNSGKICDCYCEASPVFKVIHQNNHGVSVARNKGLDIANGKYVMFVDADDSVSYDFCRIPFELAEKHNCDIVAFSFKRTDTNEQFGPSSSDCGIRSSNDSLYLLDVLTIYIWNKLYRRNLFDDITFIPNHIYEEHAILPKLIHKANQLYLSDIVLYNYTLYSDSLSLNTSIKTENDRFETISIKVDDYRKWGIYDYAYQEELSEAYRYLFQVGNAGTYSHEAEAIVRNSKLYNAFFTKKRNAMITLFKINPPLFYKVISIIKT